MNGSGGPSPGRLNNTGKAITIKQSTMMDAIKFQDCLLIFLFAGAEISVSVSGDASIFLIRVIPSSGDKDWCVEEAPRLYRMW